MSETRVLFVCMGNICRSPTAHGVFEALVKDSGVTERISVDSAGTHAYHVGEPPDLRSQATAQKNGIDLSNQRAQKVKPSDFEVFDYIIAMDSSNYQDLLSITPKPLHDKVYRLMDFATLSKATDVPDPYYGGDQGFDNVFTMVSEACEGLLTHLLSK